MKMNRVKAAGLFLLAVLFSSAAYSWGRDRKNADYRAVRNYRVILRWLENKNAKKSAKEYLKRHQYESFAIYGVGEMGRILLEELRQDKVFPRFIIERNSLYQPDFGVPVISYDEIGYMEEVDAVIVTPIHMFMEVANNLKSAGYRGKIISLEDIIFDK